MNKPKYISKNDWNLLEKKFKNLEPIIKKINHGYPIQYLIGNVDFYGYQINVNPNVLIPRFETEGLVQKTLDIIKKMNFENASVLDIGTGSGCISIVLKKEIDSLEITAIDISFKALWTAKRNARLNGVKINFIRKDLFKYNLINNYDVIISNPPYIKYGSDVDDRIKYEPHNAIYVDGNPLKYYEKIFKVAINHLNKKNFIALEIDEDEGKHLKELARCYFPKANILIEKDLADKDRYLFIINE